MKVMPWCGCLLLIAAHAGAADCAEWHSREFFKTASLPQVRECLAAGADLQARGRLANPPLHEAAWATPDPAVVGALLAAGTDPAAADIRGNLPWDYAEDRAEIPDSDAFRRLRDAWEATTRRQVS